jgi:hypothetical protein
MVEEVTRVAPDEDYHFISYVLSGGEKALMNVGSDGGDEIHVLTLATGEMRPLSQGWAARYTPSGHLLFHTDSALMAARFDADAGELLGPAVPILEDVRAASISETGTLVYSTGASLPELHELVWVTRSGDVEPVEPSWAFSLGGWLAGWSLSPDESRLAVMVGAEDGGDIWIKHLPDGPRTQITFHKGLDRKPRWAPDGRVTYVSDRSGSWGVWTRNADGTAEPSRLYEHAGPGNVAEAFLSPDGEWLVFRLGGAQRLRDVLALRLGVDSVPRPLLAGPYEETGAALSPDGRWLAYASDEQDEHQVFVRPFPDVESGKIQVSPQGGIKPVWSKDGRELLFVDGEQRMTAAQIETSPTFRVTGVEELFAIPDDFAVHRWFDFYDVTADGQRFIMARRVQNRMESVEDLILVRNFFTELEERVGGRE